MDFTVEKIIFKKEKKKERKKSRKWTSTSTCVRTVHLAAECKVTSSYGKGRPQPGSQRCHSFCPANTIVRLCASGASITSITPILLPPLLYLLQLNTAWKSQERMHSCTPNSDALSVFSSCFHHLLGPTL